MNDEIGNGEHVRNRSRGGGLLAGLMLGGVIGAGTLLLLAPQAGKRTREELQAGAIDVKERATGVLQDAVSQARSRAEHMAGTVRDRAKGLQNQGTDLAIQQLDRVASVAQQGKEALRSTQKRQS